MRRRPLETGSESAASDATEPAAGAKVPATLRDPGAIRFWIAIVLTGLCAGLGAALLTLLFNAAQELAWGASEPSALLEAARQASPERHVGLLLAAGLVDRRGSMAADAAHERQQHRHHGGDLVSGRPHAGVENARQRGAVDRHRRHGRSARPRRRARSRSARSSAICSRACRSCRTSSVAWWSRSAPARAWPRSTACRSAARCLRSKCCAERWRCGWSSRRSPPR